MVTETTQSDDSSAKTRSRQAGILLVEDESQLRELIGAFLASFDFKVFSAETGPQALQLFGENRDEIDILFTDIVLPGGITGIEIAQKITEEKRDIQVVITSGYRLESISDSAKIEKLGHFVPKPYHPRTIISLFQKILGS